MKIRNIIQNLSIYVTNEEQILLDNLSEGTFRYDMFNEHQQIVVDNLIRKSLIIKNYNNGDILVQKNIIQKQNQDS